jgi:hypothetical protein
VPRPRMKRWACATGIVAGAAFLVSPASASACSPTDPQGQGQKDQCTQSFTTPYPTAMGQTVTDYAIEYVPKGSVSVDSNLGFNPTPSHASLSAGSLEKNPITQNPDGTFANPGPNEDAYRMVWTWTGTGTSSPSSGTATFSVGLEEPVQPLSVELHVLNTIGDEIGSTASNVPVTLVIGVTNPNDDPIHGAFSLVMPLIQPRDDVSVAEQPIQQYDGVHDCAPPDLALGFRCILDLPAGGTGSVRTGFTFDNTWPYGEEQQMFELSAGGNQISDGQGLSPNSASSALWVEPSQPFCAESKAALPSLTLTPACSAALSGKKCKKGKKTSAAFIAKKKCRKKH